MADFYERALVNGILGVRWGEYGGHGSAASSDPSANAHS